MRSALRRQRWKGLAGLAAGWRLRHWDTVLLESGSRVGGRIRSERRGRYWLNWGGHVLAGAGSSTDALLTETGIIAAEVPGSLAGVAMNGRLLIRGPVQAYPFRIPMPLSSRIALLRAGAKVSGQVLRYARIVRQRPGEDPVVREQVPWGGFKGSGYGRDLSVYALDDYSRTKHVMHNVAR